LEKKCALYTGKYIINHRHCEIHKREMGMKKSSYEVVEVSCVARFPNDMSYVLMGVVSNGFTTCIDKVCSVICLDLRHFVH